MEEKLEMEEQFRERIGQVKDEFSKELQTSTQEIKDKHRKELGLCTHPFKGNIPLIVEIIKLPLCSTTKSEITSRKG